MSEKCATESRYFLDGEVPEINLPTETNERQSGSSIELPVLMDGNFRFLVAFLLATLGFPFLYLSQPLHFDEAIFLTIGEQLASGATLYTDIADHKPPGVFYLAAAVYALPGPPILLARLLTYGVIGASGLLVVRLGKHFLPPAVAQAAGVLFVVMSYLPHFDGYFFMTEQFAVLMILLAAVAFFRETVWSNILAGAALGAGVFFNQTVFLFGATIILFCLLRLRYSEHRSRDYITMWTKHILTIGIGFLTTIGVATLLLAAEGILEQTFYYSLVVPLTNYSTPFDMVGHLFALGSLLPVWLLTGGAVCWTAVAVVRGDRVNDWFLFVVLWAAVMALPGIKAFSGDHKFLFVFPAIALVAVVATVKLWSVSVCQAEQFRRLGHQLPDRSALLTGVMVVAVVSMTFVAVAGNAYALSNRAGEDIADQRATVTTAVEGLDGQVYGYNVQGDLYALSDVRPGTTYLGTIYSDDIAQSKIDDLERQEIEYVIVQAGLVSGREVVASGYWPDHKSVMVEYLNENYDPVRRTDNHVVFRRTSST